MDAFCQTKFVPWLASLGDRVRVMSRPSSAEALSRTSFCGGVSGARFRRAVPLPYHPEPPSGRLISSAR